MLCDDFWTGAYCYYLVCDLDSFILNLVNDIKEVQMKTFCPPGEKWSHPLLQLHGDSLCAHSRLLSKTQQPLVWVWSGRWECCLFLLSIGCNGLAETCAQTHPWRSSPCPDGMSTGGETWIQFVLGCVPWLTMDRGHSSIFSNMVGQVAQILV